MSSIVQLPAALLAHPRVYNAIQWVLGGKAARERVIERYLLPDYTVADRVLDIGCGTAYVLDCLPADCRYTGCDTAHQYLTYARAHFGHRAGFYMGPVSKLPAEATGFRWVLALGLLHHLSDEAALTMLHEVVRRMDTGATIICLDGVYQQGQSRFSRLLLRADRGNFIRDEPGYAGLLQQIFGQVETEVDHKLFYFPYTACVSVGTKQR